MEGRRVVPANGGGAFGWWWVWVVIIIAAFWFAGWGWGGYGGWWWGGRRPGVVGRVANPGNPAYYNGPTTGANNPATYGAQANGAAGANGQVTGSGLEVLDSTNKMEYVGKSFQIDNVPVQGSANDHAIWIGTNHAARMLVISNGSVNPAITTGSNGARANLNGKTGMGTRDLVNVNGTVEKAPPEAQAKKQWGLSNDAAKQLERQGVYVMASQVQPAQLASANPSANGTSGNGPENNAAYNGNNGANNNAANSNASNTTSEAH